MSTTTAPTYLARVPNEVLYARGNSRLARWLAARHWRPSLAQIEAERDRRQPTDQPPTDKEPT